MRKFRGIIALVLSIILGLIAAKAVYWYLNRPKPVEKPAVVIKKEPEKKLTFSDKIPEGMRAVSFKLDKDSRIPKGLKRGDLVDVAVTSSVPDKKNASVTRIILEGITINDTGEAKDDKKSKSSKNKEKNVTLLLTPEQALNLIAASESAKIDLFARNKADNERAGNIAAAYTFEKGIEKVTGRNESDVIQPQPGMRAITLTARDTDGILGVFKPGDRVDIIITSGYGKMSVKGLNEAGATGKVTDTRLSSKTMLQNVKILASEKTLSLGVGSKESARRLTLLVTPEQALQLTVVADTSKKNIIRFIGRNPSDNSSVTTDRVYLTDIVTDKKEIITVHTFRGGGQHSSRTFYR